MTGSRTPVALVSVAVLTLVAGGLPSPASAQSLRGSAASLDLQNRVAADHDFTYLSTGSQLRRFVRAGYLVPVRADGNFELHAVSFPYARPEVELFVRRLSRQYRAACGEQLVVTSLTRPENRQPRNASDRSVHPTGMAMDLRRSDSRACRAWLEDVLLSLERARILEATRERWPPHYHVALFPRQYASYVERITGGRARLADAASTLEYRVRRGDSLWEIARSNGVTVEVLKRENGLDSSTIYAGQLLEIPVRAGR